MLCLVPWSRPSLAGGFPSLAWLAWLSVGSTEPMGAQPQMYCSINLIKLSSVPLAQPQLSSCQSPSLKDKAFLSSVSNWLIWLIHSSSGCQWDALTDPNQLYGWIKVNSSNGSPLWSVTQKTTVWLALCAVAVFDMWTGHGGQDCNMNKESKHFMSHLYAFSLWEMWYNGYHMS